MGFIVRSSVRSAAVCAALVAIGACGGGGAMPAPDEVPDLDSSTPTPREDAGGRDGGRDAGRDAGSDAGSASSDGPLVKVLSPAATDDPDSEDVIASSTLTVRCQVKKNPTGDRIDPSSVKVSVYAGDETKPAVTAKTAAAGSDVYEAKDIDVSNVAHGSVRIECEASDLATMAEHSVESIYTLLDKGPVITILDPMDKGFVPAGVSMGEDLRVRFRVAPQPLGTGDTGAEVDGVKATFNGKVIAKLDPSTTEENVYSFGVDFNDTTMFAVVPDQITVRVDASNKRAPEPRAVNKTISARVDAEGPTIAVVSPAPTGGQLPVISGRVNVVLTIKDALSGVKPGSVFISISAGGKTDTYKAEPGTTDQFVAIFETAAYPDRPTLDINISATDNVGLTKTSNLKVDIDTVPPWISMDPPTVREAFTVGAAVQCTGPFAPLGDDVVKEGRVVGQVFRPRVLIWDRALVIGGDQRVARYAMINLTTARLYVQHNADVPLLIDADKDANHECDAINFSEDNVDKKPTTLVLTPVASQGQGPFPGLCAVAPDPFVPDFAPEPAGLGCTTNIGGMCPPNRLSNDTSMTRIIKHTAPGNIPVVFADSPTATGARSTGTDYVSADPGWQCLVAVAKDNAGNFAFSPPLRVCLEFKGVTCEETPPASLTCTDGCVIPAQFQRDAPDRMPRIVRY